MLYKKRKTDFYKQNKKKRSLRRFTERIKKRREDSDVCQMFAKL